MQLVLISDLEEDIWILVSAYISSQLQYLVWLKYLKKIFQYFQKSIYRNIRLKKGGVF